MSTGGTVLGGIGRIDLLELPTGAFSLVREKGEELRPRRIPNASVQTSVGVHFVDMDVFHEDPSVLLHDLPPRVPPIQNSPARISRGAVCPPRNRFFQ